MVFLVKRLRPSWFESKEDPIKMITEEKKTIQSDIIKEPKFILFDTETTGLHVKESELLTAYVAVLDDQFEILEDIELECKPDGFYKVNPYALKINKIDLVEHNAKARSYTSCSNKLQNFLVKHYLSNSGGFKANKKLKPIGQNFNFDVSFFKEYLVPDWERFVMHKGLDTGAIAEYLVAASVLPPNMSTSIADLAKHFGIAVEDDKLHTCKGDALLTLEVVKKLVSFFKDKA